MDKIVVFNSTGNLVSTTSVQYNLALKSTSFSELINGSTVDNADMRSIAGSFSEPFVGILHSNSLLLDSNLASYASYVLFVRNGFFILVPPIKVKRLRHTRTRAVFEYSAADNRWAPVGVSAFLGSTFEITNPFDSTIPAYRMIGFDPINGHPVQALAIAGSNSALDFNPGADANTTGTDDANPFQYKLSIDLIRLYGITNAPIGPKQHGTVMTEGVLELPKSPYTVSSGNSYGRGDVVYCEVLALGSLTNIFCRGYTNVNTSTNVVLSTVSYTRKVIKIGTIVGLSTPSIFIDLNIAKDPTNF